MQRHSTISVPSNSQQLRRQSVTNFAFIEVSADDNSSSQLPAASDLGHHGEKHKYKVNGDMPTIDISSCPLNEGIGTVADEYNGIWYGEGMGLESDGRR